MATQQNTICQSALLLGTAVLTTLVVAGLASAESPKRCTVNDAKTALQNGGNSALCGCDFVTVGLIRYIQDREDFAEVAQQAAAECRRIADVLTDPSVASAGSRRFAYVASDPRGAARGDCSESQCGSEQQSVRFDPPPADPPEYDWPDDDGCGGCEYEQEYGPDYRTKNPKDFGITN